MSEKPLRARYVIDSPNYNNLDLAQSAAASRPEGRQVDNMNENENITGKLFSKLFNQLDFKDQVYILQCMNEMLPPDQAEKVIDIQKYLDPEKET